MDRRTGAFVGLRTASAGRAGCLAGALAVACLAAPAAAGDGLQETVDSQEKRIEELERRLKDLEGRGAGDRPGEDIGAAVERYLQGRASGPDAPAGDRFRIGGYASILYRSPDDPSSVPAFEAIRVVPQLSFEVSKGIDFAMEAEFEDGGVFDGTVASGEVVLEYAETRFRVSDAFVPKAGILLVPFLRYNQHHDDPIWNLQDRPFTASRLVTTAFMQPGVGAEGAFPVGGGTTLNYDAALTNGLHDGPTETPFEDGRTPFGQDNNHNKAFWVRAGATPRLPFLDAADFGLSFTTSTLNDDGTPTVRMTGWGLDMKATKGRFDLLGEWTAFHYDRPAFQPVALYPRRADGAFLEVDTRLLRGLPPSKSGLVGRDSELVLAVRWEFDDLNERVTGSSPEGDARALTVGLAFRFTPKTVVRIERKEERSSFAGPAGRDRSQWVFSLSTYF